MALRGKRQSDVITNVHGVRFTASEAKSFIKKMKTINKRVNALYKRFTRAGLSAELARRLAGDEISVTLNSIKNKAGAISSLNAAMKKATMRRVVNQNITMIDNVMGILADRYGLTQEQLEIIDDAIRGMSVTEFAKWYESNEDLVDVIFDTSPVHGSRIVSQDELDHIAYRLEESLGVII